jgi:hypothetical protein
MVLEINLKGCGMSCYIFIQNKTFYWNVLSRNENLNFKHSVDTSFITHSALDECRYLITINRENIH